MISLEKWMMLAPLQKLHNNVCNLGKIFVATGFELLPKVQKIAQSGHTARAIPYGKNYWTACVGLTGLDSAPSVHSNNDIFTCLVKQNPVKLEASCTVILPPTVSVLWPKQSSLFWSSLMLVIWQKMVTYHTTGGVGIRIIIINYWPKCQNSYVWRKPQFYYT